MKPTYQGQLVNGQIPAAVADQFAPMVDANAPKPNAFGTPSSNESSNGVAYDASGVASKDTTQYQTQTRVDGYGNNYQVRVPVPAASSAGPTEIGMTTTSPTGTTTPANAEKVQDTAQPTSYQIKSGDTLANIAAANGTNIQALMAANPDIKNPNLIIAGKNLNIPGAIKQPPATDTANKYQNDLHSAIDKVTDTSDASKVAAAAATVPYGDPTLPPAAQTTTDGLIGTIATQIQQLNAQAPVDLVQNYKDLSTELGLDQLNTDYINTENIINGTENDIRTEVTKAGGFMSESQVQALAASRNKALIIKANGLQQAIATKTATLSTLSGLSEDQQKMANDRVNTAVGLEESLLSTTQTMQANTSAAYNKIVTNVGYKGLAGALAGDPYSQALAEKSLGLPIGTLSNPAALSKLDTYREQTLAQGQQRINVSVNNAASLADSRDALTLSRYASATNSVIKALYPTNKNPIQAYNASSQSINRVDTALGEATDPKNNIKGPADLDLVDAYVSIARGGQPINEAQVETLLGSLGISAKFDVASQKITGTGVLDDGTRKEIAKLSHGIYDGQKQLADQAVSTINQRLEQAHVPSDFYFTSPEEVGDTSQYSGGTNVNGTHYDVGENVGSFNGVSLTAQADGSLLGSDGHTYDMDGNEIN